MHLVGFAALFSGAVALSILFISRNARGKRFPPSPPSDFVLGHVRRIPLEYSWEIFASWRKTLGNVIYIHVLGNPMLIINSAKVARDLMEARGASFSDRPHMPVINEIVGLRGSLPFLPYGEPWRKQRRFIQRYFDPQGIRTFRPTQEDQVRRFIGELLADPEDFVRSIESLAARLIMKVTYGFSASRKDDPLSSKLCRAATLFAQLGEGGVSIIDFFPILKHIPIQLPSWCPGVSAKRHALSVRKILDEVKSEAMEEFLMKKAAGMKDPCFLDYILDDYEETPDSNPELEVDVPTMGFITFLAAFDTTVATVLTLILFMTSHPEVVKRAQAEIDEIIGSQRTPTPEDRGQLPYIDCIVKEVYRMHPAAPINVPHLSAEAQEYGDWVIPRKTTCIANIWGMMKDETNFSNPNIFSPERHLDIVDVEMGSGDVEKEIPSFKDRDPSQIVFGFGRRICPGRFYADANVWLITAKMLSVFDIGPYFDPSSGKQIYPEIAFQPSLVSGPKRFKCEIKPRSPKHIELIKRETFSTLNEDHV